MPRLSGTKYSRVASQVRYHTRLLATFVPGRQTVKTLSGAGVSTARLCDAARTSFVFSSHLACEGAVQCHQKHSAALAMFDPRAVRCTYVADCRSALRASPERRSESVEQWRRLYLGLDAPIPPHAGERSASSRARVSSRQANTRIGTARPAARCCPGVAPAIYRNRHLRVHRVFKRIGAGIIAERIATSQTETLPILSLEVGRRSG
jgi:hypothetical protein